jgi:hypothetical protein
LERKVHFAVDDLSAEAQRAIRDICDKRSVFGRLTVPESQIASEVERLTGEKIAAASLNRFVSWYCAKMRDRALVMDKVEATAATLAKHGAALTDAARANVLEAFYQISEEGVDLKKTPPFLLGKLALSFAENDRRDRELKVKERALELKEKDLQETKRKNDLLEAKQNAIDEKLKKAKEKKALNPEEAARLIDDLYGLSKT